MKRTVIMLSGWLQSGKDTVGDFLCKNFGFQRFAFADVLKDEVSQMLGLERSILDTQKGKSSIVDHHSKKTVRDFLIEHGQQKRSENPDYWVNLVVKSIQMQERLSGKSIKRIVVTDWRFPNEYHSMKSLLQTVNMYAWRINRWDIPPLVDPTELALDDFSFHTVIDNKSTLQDLHNVVRKEVYLMKDGNVRILLTDVDDVLLQWMKGFSQFVQKQNKYKLGGTFPHKWELHGWVRDLHNRILPLDHLRELVLQFNHSEEFQNLLPCDKSADALRSIKKMGYHVVAISSCTDDTLAGEKRRSNLKRFFHNLIDHVILLPLGSSKIETLSKYPPSIWIDDNIENVKDGSDLNHQSFVMSKPWNISTYSKTENLQYFQDWEDVEKYLKGSET